MLLNSLHMADSLGEFITVLLIFLFVLAVTYVTTRWIAAYQKGSIGKHNIEVIESCQLMSNKYVQIIKVGEKYLAIAVAKDTITLLAELQKEQIQFPSETSGKSAQSFKELLEKAKNGKKNDSEKMKSEK